jgi:ferrous iron transport protein A
MSTGFRGIVRLTEFPKGMEATVVKIKTGAEQQMRLGELGMHPGSRVKILCGEPGQGVLIAAGDGRIGVNWDEAQRIYVC